MGLNPSIKGGKSSTIRVLHTWLDQLNLKYVSFSNIYEEIGEYKDQEIKRDHLREICSNYDKVLALGTKVGDVLGNNGIPHFKLPHPSGRNRQLNDKGFLNERLELCKSYLGA